MNNFKMKLSAVALLVTTGSFAPMSTLCSGFLPENDMKIPISVNQVGGITEAEFNTVIDGIIDYYGPIVASQGARLTVSREWDDPTVNASANRSGNIWNLNMYGGLARHPAMTIEGFTLVICHEMGHHVGGAPKIAGWFSQWASNEGASDYFASLKCMRKIFNERETQEFVDNNQIDGALRTKCEATFSTIHERNVCMRSGMGGFSTSKLFQDMRKEKVDAKIETPDPKQVSTTDDSHPGTQCRLDTYYQGAICVADINQDVSQTDANVGNCNEIKGDIDGLRPRCWYKP